MSHRIPHPCPSPPWGEGGPAERERVRGLTAKLKTCPPAGKCNFGLKP